MPKTKQEQFKPHVCAQCTQTTDYTLTLSRGNAMMMIAVANAVDRLGRNKLHLANEMMRDKKDFSNIRSMVDGGWITYQMLANLMTLHRHGLLRAADEPGEWIITPKGGKFLKGEEVQKVAIVSKVTHHQEGYYEPGGVTTIHKLLKISEPWWSIPTGVLPEGIETGNLFNE